MKNKWYLHKKKTKWKINTETQKSTDKYNKWINKVYNIIFQELWLR